MNTQELAMKNIIVAKFGGTSLADASQIKKVIELIQANPARTFVVVSAPGKRHAHDQKMTDLLYRLVNADERFDAIFENIADRFHSIVAELNISLDVSPLLEELYCVAKSKTKTDFVISRGEAIMARILACALHGTYVEAADYLKFNEAGLFDFSLTRSAWKQRSSEHGVCVVPGFYGSLPDGEIKTFSRGGSDLTGSILAALVHAEVYENWTDVSGLLVADPSVVASARTIPVVTYKELRELTYMGARVLHDEAVFPLWDAGIPIHIRNTNRPEDSGTRILPQATRENGSIVGIAGKKDFTVITIEKRLMNQEVGFVRRVSTVFDEQHISIEHIPGGIDTLSVIVESSALNPKLDQIKKQLEAECKPDIILFEPNIALICTVGQALINTPGIAAHLFDAVANAGVNVRMINHGSSSMSIIIGVANADYETTIRAIHDTFLND